VDRGSRQSIMRWVVRDVLVHEPALRAWLKRTAGPSDIEDVIQESFYRISNLKDVSHIRSGRAYLFTTARMIILERVRRSKIVSIDTIAELEKLQIPIDAASPEDEAISRNYLEKINSIIDDLPDRCRKVFRMRKIEGLSQREVATRLGLAEHTVENDVAKGLSLILKTLTDGEQHAETSLEIMGTHERKWLSTGNQ